MPRSKAFEDIMKKSQPFISKVDTNKKKNEELADKVKMVEKLITALKKVK